jgi:hypothetical protein
VFRRNSRINHAHGQSKTFEDFGKTMNEDSRGLGRHYKGRDFVPKSQDILYGSKHPKDEETSNFTPGSSTYVPRAWQNMPMRPAMHLGHAGRGSELFFFFFHFLSG